MNIFPEERCKELMIQLGMSNSRSLYTVLMQVANEVEQKVLERNNLSENTQFILLLKGSSI